MSLYSYMFVDIWYAPGLALGQQLVHLSVSVKMQQTQKGLLYRRTRHHNVSLILLMGIIVLQNPNLSQANPNHQKYKDDKSWVLNILKNLTSYNTLKSWNTSRILKSWKVGGKVWESVRLSFTRFRPNSDHTKPLKSLCYWNPPRDSRRLFIGLLLFF